MKTRVVCLLSLLLLTWPGLAATQSYSIALPPGHTAIANHLDIGGNTLAEVLPVVPDGSTLAKWVCASQAYELYTYDSLAGGWMPTGAATLGPGEGGIFFNPLNTMLVLTFTGNPHVPSLPYLPCGCDKWNLMSRQTNGVGTFENLTGLLPVEGSSLHRLIAGNWVEHTFTGGQWVPGLPVVSIGEAVFLRTPCDASVQYKWLQPPAPITPTNIFYGWNEPSVHDPPGPVVADDWVCTTAQPVTKIRWWGSFLGWNEPVLPPGMPVAFKLTFWTDVPAMPPGFSHPGTAIHQITCYNFTARFVGWDFDPRSRTYEACFLFEQNLLPHEYFYQEPGPTGTNIYWLSIAAVYQSPQMGPLWGWKTRPRDPDSPAPDDAVVITEPISLGIIPGASFKSGFPITWPDPAHSWDTAFELIYQGQGEATKWEQVPDLTPQGLDVNATYNPEMPQPPYLLADDFRCTATGPITNLTIWGSWRHDVFPQQGPGSVAFTLSLHADIPKAQSPTGYSMPGQTLWFGTFNPGQFGWMPVPLQGEYEGWWTPPEPTYEMVGDKNCFRYDFPIPVGEIMQEGSEARPVVYWLDVQARPLGPQVGPEPPTFGWKTCPTNWNDDACWLNGSEPVPPGIIWHELRYPPFHPRMGQSLDFAFRIQGVGGTSAELIKWSQPPEPYVLTNAYNGWNEYSVYGMSQIVADDWVCTNAGPVTDIHWWGSFLGWSNPDPPQLPDAFHIAFWTDVPQGPNVPFSHPGVCLRSLICTNYAWEFVGWDIDPREAGTPPEACFKFGQNLLPEEWFRQPPGTNIYWVSIAALYHSTQIPLHPWGWKTRPRDPSSPAPDDAVRIYAPSAPQPGVVYEQGQDIWWPDRTWSWDLAFALTTLKEQVATNDFGDAPDSYRTVLASDGARHVATNLWLGSLIDVELNGQPNPAATGDDLNNLADEDGVVFTSQLIPGESATAVVSYTGTGYLSAWIDFDADGSFSQPGDRIFSDVALSGSGTYNLAFVVPITAARGSTTFMRFRFSTQTNLNYYGQAPDGEVEDYQVKIEELDFGDAPDPSFPTRWANNGARHVVVLFPQPGVFMGAQIDSEQDGQPNAAATGDDLAGLPDEDGVTLLTPLIPGQVARVQVIASLPNCVLNAWIDFGADGSWATPGDQIANNLVLPLAGPNVVGFPVPPTAAGGSQVFARFRLSTMPNLSYTGLAPNGEVEDYLWKIDQLDFGDAPDPAFPTLLANNGARHVIGGLFLGGGVDAEPDGQPNANATGDDLAGVDDEDGVFFPIALIANAPATIQVVSSGSGLLQGWFDFNRNGTWADPGEQVIVNRPVVAGTNLVTFFVPNAVAGKSYARFRLCTVSNLTFVGQAPDGEVEDYEVTFYPLKWSQRPELGIQGVDVDNRVQLADDFLCTQSGPITDIHIWGSFLRDTLPAAGPASMTITLSIYSDVPAGPGQPNLYSHPGQLLWSRTFSPGQYQAGLGMNTGGEWWHHPATGQWQPFADTNLWQFAFYIPANEAFEQVANTVYWLGVKYRFEENYFFGWKTTYMPWNDAACWFDPAAGIWRPILYGDGHPYAELPPPDNWLNLAFALSTEELDWGDAPDPTYPTLRINNGARHLIVPGLNLGHRIDAELDGQPNASATGDDINPPMSLPDEDGVMLPTLVPGQPAVVTVVASAPALLNAWIDFNRDGSWAQATDHVFADVPLVAGANNLTFLVPASTVWGTNLIARFRLCTVSNLTYTGFAPDGEVEDYAVRTEDLPQHDLGDAPDSSNHAGANMTAYPSGGPPGVLASFPTVHGGAAGLPPFGPLHMQPWAVAYLGRNVTGEWEADVNWDQDVVNNINPAADRPDQDGADDGVAFPLTLPHCRKTSFNFICTATAPVMPPLFVNVWFDWNRDGDWNDVFQCPDGTPAPEWAVQNQPVNFMVPGTYTIATTPFRCWHPSLAIQPIWMRITLSEVPVPGPLGFSGLAGGDGPLPPNSYQFGETEDYYITDYDVDGELDFGDAPDPTYPTLLASNGARHYIIPGFSLGALADGELNGLPHPLALGDDLNNQPDEDGVQIVTPWLIGTQACVNVTLTSGPGGGRLDGWVDLNQNGVWEPSEQVFVNQPLVPGLNSGLCFSIPCTARLGTNFARFRLTSAGLGGLGPTGLAQDGEVEDYLVVIGQPRPTNNIVISYISVTNLVLSGTNYQVATLYWNAQACIHYQLLQTLSLGTNNGTDIVWTAVGPEVIGPANSQAVTNLAEPASQRYYRIVAP